MERANQRLRAASVKREDSWDPVNNEMPCAWLPDAGFSHRSSGPVARRKSAARFQLRRDDLVRERLTAWWEMVACASGVDAVAAGSVGVSYATYVELQLRLHTGPPERNPTFACA